VYRPKAWSDCEDRRRAIPGHGLTRNATGWICLGADLSTVAVRLLYLIFRQVMAWLGLLARSAQSTNAEIRAAPGGRPVTSPGAPTAPVLGRPGRVEGDQVTLSGWALQLRRVEQDLSVASLENRAEVQARFDFVSRNVGEVIYDIRCRRGHSTLRTGQQITRALRHTLGRWVNLP
jgi:hypothetical protein